MMLLRGGPKFVISCILMCSTGSMCATVCSSNLTTVAGVGGVANFEFTATDLKFDQLDFRKESGDIHVSYAPNKVNNLSERFHVLLDTRMEITGVIDLHISRIWNLAFRIKGVQETDAGSYTTRLVPGSAINCWTLHVLTPAIYLDLPENSSRVEEGNSLYFNGVKSRKGRLPRDVNLTSTWFIDGSHVTKHDGYITSENSLVMFRTDRNLDRKNVTFCVLRDHNTRVAETNYTLRVTYGPDEPVFKPDSNMYVLQQGDTIPKVTCSVVCNPPCHVFWSPEPRNSNGNSAVLHLGEATTSMSGEITCCARRLDVNKTVRRALLIFVRDNSTGCDIEYLGQTTSYTVLGVCLFVSLTSVISCTISLKVFVLQQRRRKPRVPPKPLANIVRANRTSLQLTNNRIYESPNGNSQIKDIST